jgi:hypothetical protein
MMVIGKTEKTDRIRIAPDRQRSNSVFGVGKRVMHEDFMKDIKSMKQIGHAIASMEKGLKTPECSNQETVRRTAV